MVLVLCALVAALASRSSLEWVSPLPQWAVLGAFVFVVILLAVATRSPRTLHAPLLAVAALTSVLVNVPYPPKDRLLADSDYLTRANLQSHHTLSALSKIEDIRSYRVLFEGDELASPYWSMNASYYGLRSFQAFKNPLPSAQQFEEVFQRFDVANYYPLLGARYYLCRTCDWLHLDQYRFDREIGGYRLYVSDSALPRYSAIIRIAGVYASRDEFFDIVRSGFDFSHEVYIERGHPLAGLQQFMGVRTVPEVALKEERNTLNTLVLSANTSGDAILLFNEYFSEDWKVTINGLPVPPIRVNLNQIGVPLPAGASLVAFEYRPTFFVALLRLQTLTVVGGLAWLAWSWVRGRGTRPARVSRRSPGGPE